MSTMIGRNDPCPCGSAEKYKRCCDGRVPWADLLRARSPDVYLHLTSRGKNLAFLDSLSSILGIDLESNGHWDEIKKACTPKVVREIHELIPAIWPSAADLARVLDLHKGHLNSLYVGHYEPQPVFRGVTRHSIYFDHVLLFDPFLDARHIRDEYSPILHPEGYVYQTLKNIHIWLQFAPWIASGLVSFIRSPADYDFQLFRINHEIQEAWLRESPSLSRALELAPTESPDIMEAFSETIRVMMPDRLLASSYKQYKPDATEAEIGAIIAYARRKRASHPYIVGTDDDWQAQRHSEFMNASSGAGVITARLAANLSDAALVTDIPFKWKLIEHDRRNAAPVAQPWEPLAKAFGGVELPVLNSVPLAAALTLRQQGRLQSMRTFMREAFKACATDNDFDTANIQLLADKLVHEIAVAREEWRAIDVELAKWLTVTGIGGITSSTILANPVLFGVSTAIAGIVEYGVAWHKKQSLASRLPAAFFLGLSPDS